MYVGLKQPRGDGERYVTSARAAAKETIFSCTEMTSEMANQKALASNDLSQSFNRGCNL